MRRRLWLSLVSLAIGAILGAAAACDSVPDIRFVEDDGGDGSPRVDGRAEAATPDADPDAPVTPCTAGTDPKCCFGVPCGGDHCTDNKDSCRECPSLGCRQGQVCCTTGPREAVCAAATNCP